MYNTYQYHIKVTNGICFRVRGWMDRPKPLEWSEIECIRLSSTFATPFLASRIMQEPTIINVFGTSDSPDDVKTFDIASSFSLQRIKAQFIVIPAGSSHQFTVPPKRNHLFYLISGAADIDISNQHLAITRDGCFSFAESDQQRTYSLLAATGGDSTNILIIEDKGDRISTKKVRN
jgi:hypothetical protein